MASSPSPLSDDESLAAMEIDAWFAEPTDYNEEYGPDLVQRLRAAGFRIVLTSASDVLLAMPQVPKGPPR